MATTVLSAQDADRIWGRVLTSDGDQYEGFIRWDRNEANWADLLSGSKEIFWDELDEWETAVGDRARDERSIEFMGIRVTWDDDDSGFPSSAESGIRFGHIENLTVLSPQRALLRLRSGEDVEFEGGLTDIGRDIRELLIEDPNRGTVELRWIELDEIEFFAAPETAHAEAARLFGTVEDVRGSQYTGFISWDSDEVLTTDILDGEEGRRDREIEFASIAAIERLGRRASIITLRNGDEIELTGSNDVARGHRGVQISDPGLGQIEVEWDEFDSVRFLEPAAATGLATFDGGHRLRGTVATESGDSITGWIRWDGDELNSWELLDGMDDDISYDVEFGFITSIVKRSWQGSEITLRDGRVLELSDSNDVDENNRGIFIETDSGEKVVIDWFDFASITFEHR